MKKTLLFLFLAAAALIGSGNRVANKSSGGSGGSPAFGAETQIWGDDGSGATDVIALTSGISAGTRGFIMPMIGDATGTLSSVTDSKGNTWSVHVTARQAASSQVYGAIATAHITTALTTSDTITLTWASVGGYCSRKASIGYLTNCASSGQPDVSNSASIGFQSSAPSVSATAASAATVAIGFILENQVADTQSSPSFTYLSKITGTGCVMFSYQKTFASSGSKTMTATLSDTCYWATAVALFK